VERDALNRDWGDKPTKRFFQQVRGKHQSTTIRALYRYDNYERRTALSRLGQALAGACERQLHRAASSCTSFHDLQEREAPPTFVKRTATYGTNQYKSQVLLRHQY
jgi:hypothetical protein